MKAEYIEKIYAGWLAKIIGIRFGAPVEGWPQEKIEKIFGSALKRYPADYVNFAADDDSNGPIFLFRALEDSGKGADLKAEDVAEALLNYAPFEHGFFWWGGYGISTEHTAYLNLRNGIKAPRSGSVMQNGSALAEQIGGQIFIDAWGLAAPGDPDLAAALSREAASVTHGGNGVYGGMFIAACISCAFEETDIGKIIEKGLTYIPGACQYAKIVKTVMDYHLNDPDDWKRCYQMIRSHHGYDKYPGNCHIIPNAAVMILSLLYGEGDFDRTLEICNLCGWDTDCNVGNVAVIMGVAGGLSAISYEKWRRPINDLLICSSVVGSLNIMDIPYGAAYIIKQALELSKRERPGSSPLHKTPDPSPLPETPGSPDLPEPFNFILNGPIDGCHFEFPGSTHAMRLRASANDERGAACHELSCWNTDEMAFTGKRSLKFLARAMAPGEAVYVYKQTYYEPKDFSDSRYDPAFSPVAYPGQTIHGSACLPEYGAGAWACLYGKDIRRGKIYEGEKKKLEPGSWESLKFRLPGRLPALIGEVGFCFYLDGGSPGSLDLTGFIDDLYVTGKADYVLDFSAEKEERWPGTVRREISQFTRLKGNAYLEEGRLHLSCFDFGEVSTGHHEWEDYEAEFRITPLAGECSLVTFRSQGAMRSYAAGFDREGSFAVLKNRGGYQVVHWKPFAWEYKREYEIRIKVRGNVITARVDEAVIIWSDEEEPYKKGGIGLAVLRGSHLSCRTIKVYP